MEEGIHDAISRKSRDVFCSVDTLDTLHSQDSLAGKKCT